MNASLFDQFPRGIVCRHAIRLPVDAGRAWALIGDIGDVRVGAEFVDRIEVEGSGVGAVRSLHIKGGIVVRERIEEYSAEDRYYVYRVIDPGPLDFTHYLAMASVQPAGPHECIFMWITTATAVDGRHEEMRALLDGNIQRVFAAVKRELGVSLAA
jgi:hypothetical protein